MQWGNILTAELLFTGFMMLVFGFMRLPRFFRKRQLAKGFPWGYYTDKVPKTDPGFYNPNDHDFLHDNATAFGGMEGFGEYGEFSGFGLMGEYGSGFATGNDGSGGM